MTRRRAVVVGAGLGGLAVALRLAVQGWAVTVCEQGPAAGGKMNRWTSGGYTFDTGPSLITMPWVFEELFEAAGSRLGDFLELSRIDPIARYVFDDGATLDYGASMPSLLDAIRRIEPADVDGFWRFMELGARVYELSRHTFFRRSPFEPPDALGLRALTRMPLRSAWGNYHSTVCRFFRSPHLRQLFDRYPTYVGSSPYAAPATLAVIPYIELAFGGWYVRGGLYRIVEAAVELCRRNGVEIRTGARVTRVEHTGRRITSVTLASGERLPADSVVMNADASRAPLLTDSGPATLPVKDRSLSGFVLLLGTRRTLPGASQHTVLFSSDYRREFTQLFDEQRFPDDPTVYVNMPSRSDRSVVPGAGETLFVMANAPASGREWTEWDVASARSRVMERLRRGGFPLADSDVVLSDSWTPSRLEHAYDAPGGAIYGTHSHGWRRAFLRPPNRDPKIGGLYYVGGSTHPGGGTPTVLMSARITSDRMARDFAAC